MSKCKPYLVITRPEPGLSETVKKVSALGWCPLAMPVMMIQLLPVISIEIEKVQAIIFTSRQAIAPIVKQLSEQHVFYEQIPVFTVGNATAKDAYQAGFCNVMSANQDAVALAALIKDKLSPLKELLFPSAKGQGQLLIALLKEAGFSVAHQEVYQAQSVQALPEVFLKELQKETINSILFFSSETARFFLELIPEDLHNKLRAIQAIAISIKTKKILEQVFWRSIEVADHPKTEEMLCLIKEHF